MKTDSIGAFIQVLRKDKGLTQKELAEIIGVSDKTISKWENGNSLPDTSMLLPLCEALDIGVNELLSCERISPEDYSAKAEETIISLIKENENSKKNNRVTRIVGIILLLIAIVSLFWNTPYGYEGIMTYSLSFVDFQSLALLVILTAGILLASGVRKKQRILELLSKIVIPIGVILSLASTVVMLTRIENPSALGVNMHVILLYLIYAFIIKIVVEVLRVKQK